MKTKVRVYVETTVVSYLVARPSRDLRVAAHQEMTGEWWAWWRDLAELYVSRAVVDEAAAGDPEMAARRLDRLKDLPRLELTTEALTLAECLTTRAGIPREAAEDALHIAVAAVHGIDFLVTWNCRHIANAMLRQRIARTCSEAGYEAPVICTPEELMEIDNATI